MSAELHTDWSKQTLSRLQAHLDLQTVHMQPCAACCKLSQLPDALPVRTHRPNRGLFTRQMTSSAIAAHAPSEPLAVALQKEVLETGFRIDDGAGRGGRADFGGRGRGGRDSFRGGRDGGFGGRGVSFWPQQSLRASWQQGQWARSSSRGWVRQALEGAGSPLSWTSCALTALGKLIRLQCGPPKASHPVPHTEHPLQDREGGYRGGGGGDRGRGRPGPPRAGRGVNGAAPAINDEAAFPGLA